MNMLTKVKGRFTFSFAHTALVTLLLFVSMCIFLSAQISKHDVVDASSQNERAALKEKIVEMRQQGEQLQAKLDQANNQVLSLQTQNEQMQNSLEHTLVQMRSYRQEIVKSKQNEVKPTAVKAKRTKPKVTALSAKPDQAVIARNAGGEWTNFTATAYTAKCKGCSGITATGYDVRDNSIDHRVIAVDPRVIPLGSIVEIKGMGYYKAVDTGGAIKGKKIDILFQQHKAAMDFGRKKLQIRIVEKGKRDAA